MEIKKNRKSRDNVPLKGALIGLFRSLSSLGYGHSLRAVAGES
jgi:hypothetical protein